jgi:putative DNA methylase
VTYNRKLIEVALPLDAINRESAREKSIRHGHPSTFHLWWARRPLAACRAVLFSSLVDDPSALPGKFPTEEAQESERQRLFRIIEELVKWENTANETVLSAARREILRSCDGQTPPVIDPFCGGGSIPLEAQRLGLEVHASDLNPVAVLITKALVELPSRFAGRPPLHVDEGKLQSTGSWRGAQGLAEDVRFYGQWMRDEAEQRIGYLYPRVELPTEHGSGKATAVAWLWARTIECPNPVCGSRMPLLTSLALSKRKGREAWLRPIPERAERRVRFRVERGPGCPSVGSVGRSGSSCLVCGASVPLTHVREAARSGDLGAQLVCTVAQGERSRIYLDADGYQRAAADIAPPDTAPETEVPYISGIFNTPIYGLHKHRSLFTNRQLVTLQTFSELALEAREAAVRDGAEPAYADAILTYLALAVGRLANRCSSQCFWDTGGEGVMQVFARQALPMVWAYARVNSKLMLL